MTSTWLTKRIATGVLVWLSLVACKARQQDPNSGVNETGVTDAHGIRWYDGSYGANPDIFRETGEQSIRTVSVLVHDFMAPAALRRAVVRAVKRVDDRCLSPQIILYETNEAIPAGPGRIVIIADNESPGINHPFPEPYYVRYAEHFGHFGVGARVTLWLQKAYGGTNPSGAAEAVEKFLTHVFRDHCTVGG